MQNAEASRASKVAGWTGTAARRLLGTAATIIRWIGLFIVLMLVANVVLTVGGANPNNPITTFVRGFADPLALQFRDLFPVQDPTLHILVNYGLAAIFWLVLTTIIVKVINKLAA